uniref:E2Fa2-2 n=1 Tax=Arundo donax TaxID=35708 RepID=A0A0A9CL53_ARUDO
MSLRSLYIVDFSFGIFPSVVLLVGRWLGLGLPPSDRLGGWRRQHRTSRGLRLGRPRRRLVDGGGGWRWRRTRWNQRGGRVGRRSRSGSGRRRHQGIGGGARPRSSGGEDGDRRRGSEEVDLGRRRRAGRRHGAAEVDLRRRRGEREAGGAAVHGGGRLGGRARAA